MKYRIKEGVGIYLDPWLNRYRSHPCYYVQERYYFWWITLKSFNSLEVATSYIEALKAQEIAEK